MSKSDLPIIIIVGLTGVGKSTTLEALKKDNEQYRLLPNRRELTDQIIIPEIQRELGLPEKPVKDRLQRFELTRRYRRKHSGGMVYALHQYLATLDGQPSQTLLLDNLRGLEEVKSAVETLSNSRFIFFDAPDTVRLERLLSRRDSFDFVEASELNVEALEAALRQIEGGDKVFDLPELAALVKQRRVSEDDLLDAVRIIVTERQNYDATAALDYLQCVLAETRLLYLDTSLHSLEYVVQRIQRWL